MKNNLLLTLIYVVIINHINTLKLILGNKEGNKVGTNLESSNENLFQIKLKKNLNSIQSYGIDDKETNKTIEDSKQSNKTIQDSKESKVIVKSKGTNVFEGKDNSTNALGYVGYSNYSIDSEPYIVKSCDQVLLINISRITDMEDYCSLEDAFFTMSTYMINIFSRRDPSKLIDSITLDKLSFAPTELMGAPKCILFESADKRLGICVKSKDLVKEILEAYEEFMRCRRGFKPLTKKEFVDLLKDCQNYKKGLLTQSKASNTKENTLQTIQESMKSPFINPFKVPGTR